MRSNFQKEKGLYVPFQVHTSAAVQIKPDIFTLPQCPSAVLLFSCCDSVEALALANCNKHVAEANISRPHPLTPSVLCTALKAREVRVVTSLNFSTQGAMWGFLVASRCIFILIMILLDHRNTATTKQLDFKNSLLTSVGARNKTCLSALRQQYRGGF
jgi:hypothetical protein